MGFPQFIVIVNGSFKNSKKENVMPYIMMTLTYLLFLVDFFRNKKNANGNKYE